MSELGKSQEISVQSIFILQFLKSLKQLIRQFWFLFYEGTEFIKLTYKISQRTLINVKRILPTVDSLGLNRNAKSE